MRQGGRLGSGSGGNGGSSVPPQPVIFPPEVYPIPGATLFALSTVPPGLNVTNAAPVVLVTIPIPAQSVGVISGIEYGANALTVASLLTFVVRFNQGPVSYGPLGFTVSGNVNYLKEAHSPLIRIPLGTTVVDVLATVAAADGATYLAGATLVGWYWTLAQATAYQQGIGG